jgi:2-amino-4-hydroxy-6-hydroxymethyldihydropteridine diphosphokinase
MAIVRVAIGLGSNLGDREGHVRAAIMKLHALPLCSVVGVSRIRETAPWGPVAQGNYLNACIAMLTELGPRHLLQEFHRIEREHGRSRATEQRWGPRSLDLDMLLFGDWILEESELVIPHPRMLERRFVLEPLAEVWPADVVIPGTTRTVRKALAALHGDDNGAEHR